MISIPRHIRESSAVPSISLGGITFVQYRSQISEIRHELCVSQHSLVFILEGTKYIHSADGDIVVKKGEAFFCRKGCHLMSEMIPDDGSSFDTVLFFFDDSMFAGFVDQLDAGESPAPGTEKAVFPIAVDEAISIFLSSMMPLFDSPLGHDDSFLRLKVNELLHYLCFSKDNSAFVGFLLACRNEMKNDLSSVMEEYFNKNISLEDMAELSGRSLSTFKREFRKVFDTTPARWIRERRLSWAAQLIRNSQKNITEISYESGYDSLSHFSSIFRSRYGVSPSEYRTGLIPSKSEL
ncbi:helix-turn-helix transcriptional regulator [Maridesulfovibrio sp.]|uniref:helix-turn-helix transcriptional regulator n=1 Tax=Maridesulfovibrio sp. TaxID=2795000 RepID=UPI002A18A00B|nr:helix-turn-helix transcriptional regulator [Maridesulfovibrio sp.]